MGGSGGTSNWGCQDRRSGLEHARERQFTTGWNPPRFRGQGSAEFVVTVAALMLILLLGLVMWGYFDSQRAEIENRFLAQRTAWRIAAAVNTVHQAGGGTTLVFYNWASNRTGANAGIIGNIVYVNYSGTFASASLLTNNTNVSGMPLNADVRVRNVGGVINVGPA